MTETHPFILRDHGKGIIEMIVEDSMINSAHKSMTCLKLLPKKFEHVILTLSKTASLSEDSLPVLEEVADSGKFGALKLVIPSPEQASFLSMDFKSFKNIDAAKKRIQGEKTVKKILKKVGELAPLKSSAHKLMPMLRDPDTPFEHIEEIAGKDPTLVARMLKRANSAQFQRRERVDCLKSAVSCLGIEGIRQILSHEIFSGFTQAFANQREKLAHMRRCAHLANYLGEVMNSEKALLQKMRISGLMHDVGALALAFYDTNEYAKVASMVRNDKVLPAIAEEEVYGINHQELGAYFAKDIGMSDYIVDAAKDHHSADVDLSDLNMLAVICANGFLNEIVEQTEFSPYEHYLEEIVRVANEKLHKIGLSAKKKLHQELKEARAAALKEKIQKSASPDQVDDAENFELRVSSVHELLKKELDHYMLTAGMDAQGM